MKFIDTVIAVVLISASLVVSSENGDLPGRMQKHNQFVISEAPTEVPSLSVAPSEVPSEIPSELPSEVPTVGPTLNYIACAPYSLDYTGSATVNYKECSFMACGGVDVTMYPSDCNQYVILYDGSGNYMGESYNYNGCPYITFTPLDNCQVYTLREGCWYDFYCSGSMSITGNVELISNAPVEVPSPVPTAAPFNCPAYSASGTNNAAQGYSECQFTACGGTTVTMNSCGACTGIQFYNVYDQSNNGLAGYSNVCSQCSSSLFQVPGSPDSCQTYSIHEGCYSDGSCSGTLTVSGATAFVLSPTYQPSTLAPSTDAPAATPLSRPPPMVYSVVIPVAVVAAVMFASMFVYFYCAGSGVKAPQLVPVVEGIEMT